MKLGAAGAVTDLQLAIQGTPIHNVVERGTKGVFPNTTLEVGSGSGKLSLFFANRGARCTLLDPDPDMRRYAHGLAQAIHGLATCASFPDQWIGIHVVNGDGRRMPQFNDNEFELVLQEGILEHFVREDQQRMVNEMARVARKWVCFTVPDARHPHNHELAKTLHHSYVGMPEHEEPMSPELCRELAEAAGLRVTLMETVLDRLLCVFAEKVPK